MSLRDKKSLIDRKKRIELRLENQGISNYKIQYLPYLDFDPTNFTNPYLVGCRIMILCAVNIAVQQKEDKPLIIDWLKNENIWRHVSPTEIQLFNGNVTDKVLAKFSWCLEDAYTLAWSLGLVKGLSDLCQPMTDKQYDDFTANVPLVGDKLNSFLSDLKYIEKDKIIDENLFNELATTYSRDIYFSNGKNDSKLNDTVSFHRHKTLNWVRRFMDIDDWDETDTST